MSPTRLEHREVEALLTKTLVGREDLADLETFLAVISMESSPPRDVQQMGSALAATARSSRRSTGRGVRRLVTLAAAGAILLATSGVALAADGSAPGDSLYGLDLALERIGLGAGGVAERVIEFDVLMAQGSDSDAFEFIADVIESAPGADARMALRHLEVAVANSSPTAAEAQAKVAAIHTFLADNLGPGIGLDGREFGQAVADLARSQPEPPETPENQGSDNAASAPGNQSGASPGSGGQDVVPPETPAGSKPEDPGSQSTQPDPPPGQVETPPARSDEGQPGGTGPPTDSGSQDTSSDDPGSGGDSGPGLSPGSNQGGGQGGGSTNASNGKGSDRP